MSERLAELLETIEHEPVPGSAAPDASQMVTTVTSDSRRVVPGSVFVAVRGHDADGHDHIGDAIARGAAVVIVQEVPAGDALRDVIAVRVNDARAALGRMIAGFWRHPDRDLSVIAVTGTNGKTTVSHLVRDLLRAGGTECGLIGTIRYETPARAFDAPLTTPAAEDLYSLFADMREHGAHAVAMEASSHALHQQRLGALEVDVAAFTNLTHEHLDYHRTLDAYLGAKLLLLGHLAGEDRHKPIGRAVVNLDAPGLAAVDWPANTLFVGRSADAGVRSVRSVCTREGTRLWVRIGAEEVELHSRLLGRYNVENLLVTAGIAVALGMDAAEIARRFPALNPVPGRLEPVSLEGGPLALVDYAHTPDGIESALRAVRELDRGPVTLVFGCGGDRDRTKRPLMARAALAGADRVVLTLDNPRTEDPEQIFADTVAGFGAGFGGEDARAERITDRQEAIAHALAITPAHGIVLVAGKGHETYQIVGTVKHPWDDRAALQQAWAALGGV